MAPVYPGFLNLPVLTDFLPWALLGAASALLLRARAGWGRPLLFGLGFFLVNLFPVLLYIFKDYTIMVGSMDHLAYLPIIGWIGLAVAAIDYFEAHLKHLPRWAARVVVTVMIILMAGSAHTYAGWYKNGEVFWTHILQREGDEWLAHENLSGVLIDAGRYGEALPHAQRFLAIMPEMSDAHYNMGLVLQKVGRPAEAVAEFEQASRLNPTDGKAYVSNGTLLVLMGKIPEAISQYRQAVGAIPDHAQLRYNLGSLLLDTGDLPGAIEQLDAAVKLDPDLAKAQENLGSALGRTGHLPEAISHFAAAVEIDPAYVIARNNLALALAQTGHLPEAIEQFQKVLETDPANAQARDSLAKLQQFETQQTAPGKK